MSVTAMITNQEILYLPLDKIMPNPYQPRKFFDRFSLEELAASIKEYGVMQPISVRLINHYTYELVAGERRLRAAKLAGLMTIPAIVVNIDDQDSAMLAMIENLQRENLNYLEEAEGFQNLIRDYHFTQEELAERIGKSQSTIANKLRILRLPASVKNLLMEKQLSERHARALIKLDDEEKQLAAIQKIAKDGLSVKKTEELVEMMLKSRNDTKSKPLKAIKRYLRDIRIFTNTIKNSVDIIKNAGMDADYVMNETSQGCEIRIFLKYEA